MTVPKLVVSPHKLDGQLHSDLPVSAWQSFSHVFIAIANPSFSSSKSLHFRCFSSSATTATRGGRRSPVRSRASAASSAPKAWPRAPRSTGDTCGAPWCCCGRWGETWGKGGEKLGEAVDLGATEASKTSDLGATYGATWWGHQKR